MKVLISGSTGFIGKNLTKRLVSENFEVVACGRSLQKLGGLLNKVKAIYLDIGDRQALLKVFREEKPEVIFHCAALLGGSSIKRLRRTNVEGTRNLLDASLKAGIKKVVYLSTVAVISGNPQAPITEDLPYKATNPYGQSKLEAEKVAVEYRNKGLNIAILRPPFVYGEYEPHLLPLLVKLMRWRLLPILGDGSNRLHLVSIDSLLDVMMLSFSNDRIYEGSYIVADKEALNMKELLGYISDILGVKAPSHIPEPFIPWLTHIPFIGKKFSFFRKDRFYSIKQLQERLGYIPRVSVYEGLREAIRSLD